MEDRTDVALAVVKEKDNGLVVSGARILATLGPLSDEIAVYPARSHRIAAGSEGRYAFGFAIPCNTPGLKMLCRESFDLGRSHFDHPLGSRFEEMDAVVFFDDVLVPWERVFLYGDVEMCNNWAGKTHRNSHTGHQVVTKNVVKCEFMLGLANLMVQTLGSGQIPQVQQLMAKPKALRRRTMMSHWARASCGMMGRTPDFLNAAVMSMASASDYCGQNRPEFKQNIERYYEYVRENDLVLTHTLVRTGSFPRPAEWRSQYCPPSGLAARTGVTG